MRTGTLQLPLALAALMLAAVASVRAQTIGTGFTYQGQIRIQGQPLTGTADVSFFLMDAATGGNQVGNPIDFTNLSLTDGLFTVILNDAGQFGQNAFTGNARWLEIDVRTPAGSGNYTTLTPRQPLTPSPFALYAASGAGSGGSVWLQSGNIAYYNAGNVGIGTAAADDRLALKANSDGGLLSLHNTSDQTKWEMNIPVSGGLSINEDAAPNLLDQSCTADSQFDCALSPLSNGQWQSFTAGLTGTLASVQVFLGSSQSATFTVDIFAGEGTSGSVLAESVIQFGPSGANGNWVTFNFPAPTTVTAGSKYTIKLTGPNGTIAYWDASCSDASYTGGKSSILAMGDGLFKTYVINGTGTPVEYSRMFLAAGGNVGIGTITPAAHLDVAGSVKAGSFIGDGSRLTGIASSLWSADGANIYYNSGNVGIGIATPASRLHVSGGGGDVRVDVGSATNDTSALTLVGARSGASPQFVGINLNNLDNNGSSGAEYSGAFIRSYNELGNDSGNLTLWTKATGDSAPLERLRIAAAGNVGIGNTSPSYQLDVTGATQSALRLDSTDTIGTRLRLSSSATGGRLYDLVSTANGNASGGGKWLLVDFTTGALTRMAVDSAGNVGIGTASPGYQLDVAAASQTALRLDSADTIGTRARLSSSATGGRIYDLVSTADGNVNGGGKWLLVDSTASVARMAVASSGDVGIGTTVPAVRLDVLDTTASDNSAAIRGIHSQGTFGIGVQGQGGSTGVDGSVVSTATSGTPTAKGVSGSATGGTAGTNYGVYGTASGGSLAYAGYFNGNVNVAGTLSKSAGTFKIDHPLDPANKYLSHSFVESPDMMNVYNGNIVTDGQGYATVQLPEWFESLNRDFRYQLTVIGSFSRAMVAQEVQSNAFVIRTEQPSVKVSWQITGIRHDAYAEAHRTPVEQDKPEFEKGSYIHPELFGQPDVLRVDVYHAAENAANAGSTSGVER